MQVVAWDWVKCAFHRTQRAGGKQETRSSKDKRDGMIEKRLEAVHCFLAAKVGGPPSLYRTNFDSFFWEK